MISRSVVSAATVKRGPSPSLYFCSAALTPWPLTARIQPFCEHSTVTGSRSTSAAAGISTAAGAAPIKVRRRPSGVSPPNSARVAAVPAAALQHLAAMIEKRLQRLLQIHHARHAERVDDIEVERHAGFEIGQPEQLLHHHIGVDVAVLRLEDEAHLLGRFITDIGEQRQFPFFEKR